MPRSKKKKEEDRRKAIERDANKVAISNHAFERAQERLSLNPKSFIRMVDKAWRNGIKESEIVGDFASYIIELKEGREQDIRIYGSFIYIFVNKLLVTVYVCPAKYIKYLKIIKQKRNDHHNQKQNLPQNV